MLAGKALFTSMPALQPVSLLGHTASLVRQRLSGQPFYIAFN